MGDYLDEPERDKKTGHEAESEVLDQFTLWKEYEKIAVHFNDLILRLRVQALGGVAALATLTGLVLKDQTSDLLRWKILAVAFSALLAFWVALWLLDLLYYNRLLLGTVDAILDVEEASKTGAPVVGLDLSSKIKETVDGHGRKWRASLRGPMIFYGMVFAVLLALAALAAWQGWCSAAPQTTAATTGS